MFPSVPKFLVLAIVIFVVFLWSRRNAVQSRGNQRNASRAQGRAPGAAASAKNAAATAKQKAIEDLVKCPSCGTYVAAGSACTCGKTHR